MKHPPIQYRDDEAYQLTEGFIKGFSEVRVALIDKLIEQNEHGTD
ncbi:MAG: hypothetical protein ACFE9X_04240 [Promethearchaeota archaeon]